MFSLATLTLATVGSWTYGAFLAEPTPPPPAPFPAMATTIAARWPKPTTEEPPPRYRMADVTGQVWEHTDPHWLELFVADRNRQSLAFVAPTVLAPINARRPWLFKKGRIISPGK